MTQQTRLNMWIPEVKTFFFGLLKTRSIQSLVVHKSDLTRGSLWITDVCEDLFLVFTSLSANMGRLTSQI